MAITIGASTYIIFIKLKAAEKIIAKFMKSIGGTETHELVQNILKRFMTNQLATHFNIQGKNLKKKDNALPKVAFKNTNLFKCIIKAAHIHRNNIDENNVIHKTIAPWLAQANLRLCREKIKDAITKEVQNETTNQTNDSDETTSENEEI
ncbi:uncharacterized protein [Anoplolepis gracilipes]|uniref:uncharacterized protein isoform X2 n=1 Tax=Anoplolepis gracilipes TaxID=354296 RepID=UPI003BA3C902